MSDAKILLDDEIEISECWKVSLKAYSVLKNKKYPEGIKVRFVLLDLELKVARLLVDNHEPYGFHIHTELPHDKSIRKPLKVSNYHEALDEFWKMTWEILGDEIN